MANAHAAPSPAHAEKIDEPVANGELEDLPVAERQYPASPEGVVSFNAWWNGMLPEERAFLEASTHSDKIDKRHDR